MTELQLDGSSGSRNQPKYSMDGVAMSRTDTAGFFLSGLLNNSSYVIMIAGAKNIAPSMVGLVYVCNVVPSFLVYYAMNSSCSHYCLLCYMFR